MKMRIFAMILMLALLLTACGSDPAQNTTAAPGTQGTTVPTTAIKPPEGEEETMDLFASLYPVDGQIPQKRDLASIVKEMAETSGRINEINYTWNQGRVAMEVLVGVYDEYHELVAPEESPLQMIYNESEYYNYILYLPEGYDPEDTEKKWPVIYFFHGYGKQGDDLSVLVSEGPTRYLEKGGKLDAILIVPQCPADSHWADDDREVTKLVEFVPEMSAKYNIDTDRMYLTGLSMGGRCTWKLALAMPDTFAAIAVICGRTNSYRFDTIQNMPVWMFHGVLDETVDFHNVNAILTKLHEHEHRYYKLTVFPQMMHNIWHTVYDRPEVYDWLLSQSITNNLAQAE